MLAAATSVPVDRWAPAEGAVREDLVDEGDGHERGPEAIRTPELRTLSIAPGRLNSRVVIEQAKGMVAERDGLTMHQAFSTLRNHARNHNLRLVDVARDVIDGTLTASALDPPPPATPS